MRRKLVSFVSIVTVGALVLAVAIVMRFPIEVSGVDAWAGVVALTVLTVLGDAMGMRSGRAVFSVSLIPTVTTVPLFGPAVAVLSTLISRIIAQGLMLRRESIKWAFNASQFALAIGVGSIVYVALGGPIDYTAFHLREMLIPVGGLIVTYFCVNMLLVATVIAIDTQKRVTDIWREIGPLAFANELASSSFSLLVVFAFTELGTAGLLVVLLPLFFVQHAYGIQFKLLKQNQEILELLVKTIEAKDPYTSGHSVRVAQFSRELARALGLASHRIDEVGTAALLHDIGKIDFAYTELISSPAQLTETEREIIRTHPERGARLLASVSSLSESVIQAVRHHHEHYDGNGYPDGLIGSEIPLAARIIMVVDTVDAMLSNRPYRAALSTADVTSELRRFSGRQFDPTITAKFIELGLVERAARRAEIDRTPLPLAGVLVRERVSAS